MGAQIPIDDVTLEPISANRVVCMPRSGLFAGAGRLARTAANWRPTSRFSPAHTSLPSRSYSLYLWHWPFLIIAAEYLGHDLSAIQNTGLLLLALAATAITYRLIENPVRHARVLAGRTWLTLAIGAILIIVTVGIAQWQTAIHYGTWNLLEPSSL